MSKLEVRHTIKPIIIFILCSSAACLAGESKKHEYIERYLTAIGATSEKEANVFIAAYATNIAEGLIVLRGDVYPKDQNIIREAVLEYAQWYGKAIIKTHLRELRYDQYSTYFSEKELKRIVKIFESEPIKKLIAIQPQILAETIADLNQVHTDLLKSLAPGIADHVNRVLDGSW